VRDPKQAFPETALQVVAAGVVGAGKFVVVEGRLAGRSALIAHRLENAAAVLQHHHRRIDAGENPRVAILELGPSQVSQPTPRLVDLAGGDPLAFAGGLGDLVLQLSLGVNQAGALREELLLDPGGLGGRVRVDQCLDLAPTVAFGTLILNASFARRQNRS